MANAAFKKGLGTLIFLLVFSYSAFSQKNTKLKEFSREFPSYLSQLEGFMMSTDNSDLRLVYKNFLKSSESFSNIEKLRIIHISNKMLSKRLRPKPHFSNFLSATIAVNNNLKGEFLLPDWLEVFDETVDQATTKKLMLFCTVTINLFADNILRSSKVAEWRVNNTDCRFSFEFIEPVIIFDNVDLTCISDHGSYTIFKTGGKYYLSSNKWIGRDGIINWELYGYPKDSVFAKVKSYEIDTRKTKVTADSSVFYNKYDLHQPIFGRVVNKIARGKQANIYPKFNSYSKDIELKEIFKNIDYKGGYTMQGKDFVADGGDYAEARIIFKRHGEDIFIANANRFNIGTDRIVSKESGIKIFFDNDSIYHGNLQFKYIDSKRQLQLYRKSNSLSGAPMLNTYHNVTMNFELLQWNIDDAIITLGSLPASAESNVKFESVAMFDSTLFVSIQGIDRIHPLMLINNYVIAKQEEEFYVEDFARFARFPLVQIQHLLIHLSDKGFVFYDFGLEKITVLPKLYNYINAASGLGDYDVISFNSTIRPGEYKTGDKYLVNAALNLETKDLNIIGIHNIQVSQARGIYMFPREGLVVIKKIGILSLMVRYMQEMED